MFQLKLYKIHNIFFSNRDPYRIQGINIHYKIMKISN